MHRERSGDLCRTTAKTGLSASTLTTSLLLALGACGASGSGAPMGPPEPSPALPAAEVYARRDAFYAYRTESIGTLAGSTYATRPPGPSTTTAIRNCS